MSKIAFSQKAISHNYVTCFQLYLSNWMTNHFHSSAKSKVAIMISGLTQSVQPSGPKIALGFPCLYCIYLGLCVPTYHMHNNYVTTLLPCEFTLIKFGNSDGCFVQLLWQSSTDISLRQTPRAEAIWTCRHEAEREWKCQE